MRTRQFLISLVMFTSGRALIAQETSIGIGVQTAGIVTDIGYFHDDLRPYGEWISIEGATVWRPLHVRLGWRPYMVGRWVWTDNGWYWVSAEPFGWAVFHYGRWAYDDYYGWIWFPDRTWGPAWVDWRYNDDYIGWAPLPPRGSGFSFSVYVGTGWSAPWHHWNFIRCREFGTAYRYREYVPGAYVRRIIGTTRHGESLQTDGGRVVNRGVDRTFLERRTLSRIESADIRQSAEARESFERSNGRAIIGTYRPNFEARTGVRAEIQRGDRGFSWSNPEGQNRGRNGVRTGAPERGSVETPIERRFHEGERRQPARVLESPSEHRGDESRTIRRIPAERGDRLQGRRAPEFRQNRPQSQPLPSARPDTRRGPEKRGR